MNRRHHEIAALAVGHTLVATALMQASWVPHGFYYLLDEEKHLAKLHKYFPNQNIRFPICYRGKKMWYAVEVCDGRKHDDM